MTRISKTLLALSFTLFGAPACDKAKNDGKSGDAKSADQAKSGDAKTKPDPHAGMDHGDHEAPSDDEADQADGADETVEVAAEGRVEIDVDAAGYHPATISAPAKSTITLAFKRTTEAGCGQQLVIKSLDISKELPLDEVVEIPVEVPESGELGFACGMDMYKGKVVPKA